MDILTQTYIVVGTGKSGVAAAGLLLKKGCKVYLYDGNENLDVAGFYDKNPELQKVEIYLEDQGEGYIVTGKCGCVKSGSTS